MPRKKINIDNKKLVAEADLIDKALKSSQIDASIEKRLKVIKEEFVAGLSLIKEHPKSITFFGSARTKFGDPYYKKAQELAGRLAREGFSVVTGGGPGIMAAANHGALEAGGSSIGFNIKLPTEQIANAFTTQAVNFHYFFSRKVCLSFSAEAFVFFPGGFGTLDEFFEIITLIQTHKAPKTPIILYSSDFWNPLDRFITEDLLEKYKTINPEDKKLYIITDDLEEIVEIAKRAPIR